MKPLDEIDVEIIKLLLDKYVSAEEIKDKLILRLPGMKPLSARATAHRIKQLQDEGAITKTIRFNHSDVGYGQGLLLVKTVNQAACENIKGYLSKNEHIYELHAGSGGFDIAANYHIREMGSKNSFINSIRNASGVEKVETIDFEVSKHTAGMIPQGAIKGRI